MGLIIKRCERLLSSVLDLKIAKAVFNNYQYASFLQSFKGVLIDVVNCPPEFLTKSFCNQQLAVESKSEDFQLDHVVPFSVGGKTEADNLRVLCRAHNMFEAKEKLGVEFVGQRVWKSTAR